MSTFNPAPIPPEELTRALRDGMQDVPRTTPIRAGEAVSAKPEEEGPPLRAKPPEDVPKRFTSFRLPVDLDEELRAMIFETRRSKQDLLIEFVTAGVQAWRKERVRR